MATDKRPLSPHLQVYRPQLTSVMSILHRATGVFLMVGTPLLIYWLCALAWGQESFHHAQLMLGSILGQLLLFGWTWAVFYHLCNGIRHLRWDWEKNLEITDVYRTGKRVAWLSVILTVVCWLLVAA